MRPRRWVCAGMKTITILVQRDMLGAIAEYTLVLVDGERRTAMDTAGRLAEARQRANELRREHGASRVTLEGT